MKKTGFKDPIAVKKRKTSSSFKAPTKEEATTGRYMEAGDDYGIGHKSPVGHEGNPKKNAPTLPFGRVKTLRTNEEN